LIRKTITDFWSEHLREPTEAEIADKLGIDVEDVQKGLADSNRVLLSLDLAMEAAQKGDSHLHEVLRDDDQPDPSEGIDEEGLLEQLAGAIALLSEREQLILSLYYNDGLTFKQIGSVLGVLASRVCQLHARAILNLKAMMQDEQ
jgi:RNA polymerase sigma factor for flagellar operon FliA